MTYMRNPYRRSTDPERDSSILWVIVTALLLIVLTSGFLYTTTQSASLDFRNAQHATFR